MRPIWSGGISFGLIFIPVKMYSAVESVQLDLDMLSKENLAPIRYARMDTKTGEEVEWDDIVKGFEVKKNKYVVLDEEDFEKATITKSDAIEIEAFVDAEQIDPMLFTQPYYLEPTKPGRKTYALLRDALKKSGKVGVAEFVFRNREHMCALIPEDDKLILNQMRYATEIRDAKDLEIPGRVDYSKAELETAQELIEKLTEKFDPEEFKDDYTGTLKKIITAKAKGKTINIAKPAKHEATDEKDLLEKLKASLQS